jgi:hypothetical protein
MPDLKLIALDEDDLAVFSAHLQDAVLRPADMAFVKDAMRFAVLANRFDWQEAVEGGRRPFARRRCGLRFERVLGAKVTGFKPGDDTPLSLMAISFTAGEAPGGCLTLTFSGGAAIRLEVECIEAELKDLGAAWETRSRPTHEPQ